MSSPVPHQCKLKRDIYNQLVPAIDGKRLTIQKRTFTKHIEDIFIEWNFENESLIKNELKNKKMNCIKYGYFCQCRPLHIVKCNYISLMSCDLCTEFNWMRSEMNTQIKAHHECKEDCKICAIINVKNPDLLNEICCDNVDHVFLPKLNCANGMCNRCKYNIYFKALSNQSNSLKISNNKAIHYKCIHDKQRITKKGKKTVDKVVGFTQKSWCNFRKIFLNKFKEYILHSYSRRIQYKSRKKLFTAMTITHIKLPIGWLSSSIDFIANIKVVNAEVPHGVSTKTKEVQVLSTYVSFLSLCHLC